MMPPKDDLLALTGGYRGTPVLQVGSDIYVDSRLIALELERRHPQPSLFPARDPGSALALITWSDAFFRSGLKIIVAMSAHLWPEPFRKDREFLFPDISFERAGSELGHARAQYRAHASLLERQLCDGRKFLCGDDPALADAFVHPFIWVMRGALPTIAAELLDDYPHIAGWERRVAERGEGVRTRIDSAAALEEARASPPPVPGAVDPSDAQSLRSGMRVAITPDDTQRGTVEGEIIAASADEVAILRSHPRSGPVAVHFPRAGYRIEPL
jgi:glutathione S-transferase